MQTSVKWSIDNLSRRTDDGVVLVAHWRATSTATEGEVTKTSAQIGPAHLEEGDPFSPDFVPYDQLTEEQVVTWVKESLGAEQVTAIETRLIAEAVEAISPSESMGKPWEAAAEIPAE